MGWDDTDGVSSRAGEEYCRGRGGFEGVENTIEERKAGVVSGLDGEYKYKTMDIKSGSGVTVERLLITRSSVQGLVKTGAGSIKVKDCNFLMNGVASGSQTMVFNGRGLYVEGSVGSTDADIENCRFDGNRTSNFWLEGGHGLFVKNLKRAAIVDCLFVTNGYSVAQSGRVGSNGTGAALYVDAVPVAVTNCSFIGNVDYTSYGGIVHLLNNCDGSTFVNCVWAGNRNVKEYLYAVDGTYWDKSWDFGMGTLSVSLGAAERTVTLENCTMAYNLCGATKSAAGVNVTNGTVNIHNSILYGNMIVSANGNDSAVKSHGNSTINISYTLMDHLPMGEGINCENVIVGEAQFVTSHDDFLNLIYTNKANQIAFPKVDMNTVDMRFNGDEETFAALVNMDMHLLSRAGYYKNDGLKYMDAKVNSPAVDAGDPASDFSKEGAPNGHRVNLGVYGNTAQASLSKGGLCIRIQ